MYQRKQSFPEHLFLIGRIRRGETLRSERRLIPNANRRRLPLSPGSRASSGGTALIPTRNPRRRLTRLIPRRRRIPIRPSSASSRGRTLLRRRRRRRLLLHGIPTLRRLLLRGSDSSGLPGWLLRRRSAVLRRGGGAVLTSTSARRLRPLVVRLTGLPHAGMPRYVHARRALLSELDVVRCRVCGTGAHCRLLAPALRARRGGKHIGRSLLKKTIGIAWAPGGEIFVFLPRILGIAWETLAENHLPIAPPFARGEEKSK